MSVKSTVTVFAQADDHGVNLLRQEPGQLALERSMYPAAPRRSDNALLVADRRLRPPGAGQRERRARQHAALIVGDLPFDRSGLRLRLPAVATSEDSDQQRQSLDAAERAHGLHLLLSGRMNAIVLRGVERVACAGSQHAKDDHPGRRLKNAGDSSAGLAACAERRAVGFDGCRRDGARANLSESASRSGVLEGDVGQPAAADHGTATALRSRRA